VAAWDGRSNRGSVPAGIYFVRFQAEGKKKIQRVIIAR
jgi:hypothetical protein